MLKYRYTLNQSSKDNISLHYSAVSEKERLATSRWTTSLPIGPEHLRRPAATLSPGIRLSAIRTAVNKSGAIQTPPQSVQPCFSIGDAALITTFAPPAIRLIDSFGQPPRRFLIRNNVTYRHIRHTNRMVRTA